MYHGFSYIQQVDPNYIALYLMNKMNVDGEPGHCHDEANPAGNHYSSQLTDRETAYTTADYKYRDRTNLGMAKEGTAERRKHPSIAQPLSSA